MPKPIYLTPEKAAQLLLVSTRTITNLLNRGDLQGRKVGDRWRLDRSAFESYIGRELTEQEAAHEEEADT